MFQQLVQQKIVENGKVNKCIAHPGQSPSTDASDEIGAAEALMDQTRGSRIYTGTLVEVQFRGGRIRTYEVTRAQFGSTKANLTFKHDGSGADPKC